MKGLHIMPLAGRSARQFQDMLVGWTQERKKYCHNSVMLFDKNTLWVGEASNIDSDKHAYRVKLSQLTIEYICINTNMCILTKVVSTNNEKEEVLYEAPESWSDACICYAY